MIALITPLTRPKRYRNRFHKSRASWLFPKGAENSYFVLMDKIMAVLKQAFEALEPRITADIDKSPYRADDVSDELSALRQLMGETVKNPFISAKVKEIAGNVVKTDQLQIEKALRSALQVDIYAHFPELAEMTKLWVDDNIGMIKSIADVYSGNLSGVISQGFRQGKSYKEMAEEIQKAYDVTRNKALFIARDQTAKLNGNISRHMQLEAGATRYEWSTSLDSRVRDSHREREGKIYNWTGTENRPPGGDPGQEYQCRCVAIPIFDLAEVKENVAGMEKENIDFPPGETSSIIKVPEPFLMVKTIAEANAYATKTLGIKYADYRGLAPEVANEWNRGLTEAFQQFPELKEIIGFVGEAHERNKAMEPFVRSMYLGKLKERNPSASQEWYEKNLKILLDSHKRKYVISSKAYAMSYAEGTGRFADFNGVVFNKVHGGDISALLKSTAKNVSNKFLPAGTGTVKSLLDHEIAHQLNKMLDLSNDIDIISIFNRLKQEKTITDELSRYAATNISEFISEVWSEYKNSSDPRAVAKQVGKIIEKRYKTWKRARKT